MRFVRAILASKWTKVPVFILCLLPLGLLVWQGLHNDLTLNPVQYIEHKTGDWVLRFLAMTLAITPLRKMLKLPQLIRFRRMLGLFAFFYVCLHFTTWVWLDRYFDWRQMLDDVTMRPFITVGFAGFVLLIPLAITSTAGWIRRLGGKRWQLLHRLVYATAILGVIHYYWLVKSDIREPLEWAFLMGALLLWRVGAWMIGRRRRMASDSIRRKEQTTAETPLI